MPVIFGEDGEEKTEPREPWRAYHVMSTRSLPDRIPSRLSDAKPRYYAESGEADEPAGILRQRDIDCDAIPGTTEAKSFQKHKADDTPNGVGSGTGSKQARKKGVVRFEKVSRTSSTKAPDVKASVKKGLFVDRRQMKRELMKTLHRSQYDVAAFYWDTGLCQAAVRHTWFETVSFAAVALNAIWIAIEIDLNKSPALFGADPVFIVFENLFCACFAVEWLLRFGALRSKRAGLKDFWFVFDLVLVIVGVMETWCIPLVCVAMDSQDGCGLGNAGIVRLLKLLRLSRLMRIVRVVRGLNDLIILIKGIIAALRSVGFAFSLMVILTYIFAVAFRQLTSSTLVGEADGQLAAETRSMVVEPMGRERTVLGSPRPPFAARAHGTGVVERRVFVEMAEMSATKSAKASNVGPVLQSEETLAWIQKAIRALHRPGGVDHAAYVEGMCGFMGSVEQKMANEFLTIRRVLNFEEGYIEEVCGQPLQAAPRFFGKRAWWTSSRRFVVQALLPRQAETLTEQMPRLLRHTEGCSDTLLPKFLGFYSFHNALPLELSTAVVFQMPPFCGPPMDYIYELNGANPDRFIQRTGVQMQVLREANFIEEQQVVMVPAHVHTSLVQRLRDDTALLENLGVDGYSLVLGIRKVETDKRVRSALHQTEDGDGMLGWRMDSEPVRYFFCLANLTPDLSRSRSFIDSLISHFSVLGAPPKSYRNVFLSFVEDRLLPIACTSALSFDKNVARCMYQPRRGNSKRLTDINTLSLLAAAELEEHSSIPPSHEDLCCWRALLDIIEAGPRAIGMWRELELVESNLQKLLPVFCADLARTPLPAYAGSAEQAQQPKGVALARIGKLLKSVEQLRALRTVGGDLVSTSSQQYSLALAIAVGVEAATTCSARIAKRSAHIFGRLPELTQRPAAVMARRKFMLPEAGSWLSPPHMLPDLSFVECAPELFAEIRRFAGMDDQAYIRCVCPRDFSFIEFTTNSKSGEFFFFTHDVQCMVKTIGRKEANSLLRLLHNGYMEHLNSEEGSLLTRIMGLYEVQLPWFNKGRPQCFIIQENLLAGCGTNILERYDLKGSRLGREAQVGDIVLKDNDWVEQGRRFGFHPELRKRLNHLHIRDCEFLAASGCIDYSVFVVAFASRTASGFASAAADEGVSVRASSATVELGVSDSEAFEVAADASDGHKMAVRRTKSYGRKGPRMSMLLSLEEDGGEPKPGLRLWDKLREAPWRRLREERPLQRPSPHGPFEGEDRLSYTVGIIDFLIPWSIRKRAEFASYAVRCVALEASVNPPWMYARRQAKFMGRCW